MFPCWSPVNISDNLTDSITDIIGIISTVIIFPQRQWNSKDDIFGYIYSKCTPDREYNNMTLSPKGRRVSTLRRDKTNGD